MSGLPPPPAPFDAWPRQLADEDGRLYGWFIAPRTLVFSFVDEEVSVATARAVVKWIEVVLYPNREAIRALGGLRVLYDARAVSSLSTESLRYFQSVWRRLETSDIDRGWYVNDGKMSALGRSIMQTLNFVAMLTTRRPMALSSSLDEPFEKLGLSAPPPPDAKFPGF